jgi:hypothetical protein
MRVKLLLTLVVLALAGATTTSFAQRAINDGGSISEPTQAPTPQYNGNGQVVAAPAGQVSETGSNCAARFHSFDPASNTYMGRDGRRHPCQ